MDRELRIGIVGCGPAGLAAALLLARRGHAITVLERFPAAEPIGSGLMLQPTGLAVLGELGLREEIESAGHRIERIHGLAMPAGRCVLDVGYAALGGDRHGLAVHRATLFDTLYTAAVAAGISPECGLEIVDARTDATGVCAVDSNRSEHGPFDLLVDASGANSRLHALAQPPPRQRPLAYGAIWGTFAWPAGVFPPAVLSQRYVGAHTMIGVLPIGRRPGVDGEQVAFFWSLRRADLAAWKECGLEHWKARVLGIWPETEAILSQIAEPEQMTFAHYGHHTLRRPFAGRLAFIGDSAHATSPQLGQGANMALLDARALDCALAGSVDLDDALSRYAALRRRHVRLFQFASLALTGFYQSDSRTLAMLRDALFSPVSRLPGMRRIVAGLVSGLLLRPERGLDIRP